MGADIYGWVETRELDSDWWDSAIRIHDIVYRQYGMFASLFGVRNGSKCSDTGDTSRYQQKSSRIRTISSHRAWPGQTTRSFPVLCGGI